MAEDPQIWAYARASTDGRLLVIANCGRARRAVEIGLEWKAAELLMCNRARTTATVTSSSLDPAGWDARVYYLETPR